MPHTYGPPIKQVQILRLICVSGFREGSEDDESPLSCQQVQGRTQETEGRTETGGESEGVPNGVGDAQMKITSHKLLQKPVSVCNVHFIWISPL